MTPFAFLFPGQGAQAVGMLDAWGDHHAVRETLAEASAALGEDVARLVRAGPQEALDLTTNTQPVMLTAGLACYRAWRAEGGAEPVALAGHSLGEYTALVAAGALTLADALPLVRFRALAMQQAVPVGAGAMAAILGLDAQAVREGCAQAAAASGEVVEAVNFNDPKQTVIAGSKAGVDKGCEVLKAMGAKRALLLSVSAPFHSSLPLGAPGIPVINNVDVAVVNDAAGIRDALYRQAFAAVRWVEVVQALRARGIAHLIECGPGKTLAGMVRRIDAEAVTMTILDPTTLAEARAMLA
jgi:[acyl-carrier-protein] S-malonyltransferase